MNQDKTFSKELVLLVLFLIRGRFVPRYRSMPSLVPEGVFIGGGESIYAFCKSRPSYLQIASIHSLVSGMDSCLFKIESNHDGLANTFHLIGFRVNDLLNQMKAFWYLS